MTELNGLFLVCNTTKEISCKKYSLNDRNYLHDSTEQAVVGSQRRIVKTPVVQVIVSGVKVPALYKQ